MAPRVEMVALIPARAGSQRIPRKNVRRLAGQPLIRYAIHAAQQSFLFSAIWVVTDDAETEQIALEAGVPVAHRSPETATDDAPDILWLREWMHEHNAGAPTFAILRPTAPFRTAATIHRAYDQFVRQEVHSIRAVEPAKQHPGKMWRLANGCLVPILDDTHLSGTPWHSSPMQTLPTIYVQNASLEMAWSYVVSSFGTISGMKIAPFFTEDYEGFNLDHEEDWAEAERLIANGLVALPTLAVR